MLGPLLDERDVVILDQRGTAHTRPHLDCPDACGLAWSAYRQGLGEDAAGALQRRVLRRADRAARDARLPRHARRGDLVIGPSHARHRTQADRTTASSCCHRTDITAP
jgi:hypothetical protein